MSSEEDAALEREDGGVHLVAHPLQERAPLLEKGRLLGGDDDHVEVVPEARILGHGPAEQEVHHPLGVEPAAVGEQK